MPYMWKNACCSIYYVIIVFEGGKQGCLVVVLLQKIYQLHHDLST